MHELVQTVSRYLSKNMGTVSGRTLANTLRSLADVAGGSKDLENLLEGAATQMRSRPNDFHTQERCMLVGTFASQRIFPGNVINESVNRVRSHSMVGHSRRIVAVDTLKIDRTLLTRSMYWGAIAHLWFTVRVLLLLRRGVSGHFSE